MKKDDSVFLRHILDAITRIEGYVGETTQAEFHGNHMQQDAVVRQIEIIDEAARNVSVEYQEAHAELPWSNMIGMRNKVIHEYFDLDVDVVWDTVTEDLMRLKEQISRLLD